MSSSPNLTRILWIAPNLNHYKIRFLSHLAQNKSLDLVILAGRSPTAAGHRDASASKDESAPFAIVNVPVQKKWFAVHPSVFSSFFRTIKMGSFDAVLMPAEKKHLPLIVWLAVLRWWFGFRLVSYNHPVLRSRGDRISNVDIAWTKNIFRLYDKLVFYTEQAMNWAVKKKLVSYGKAGFANNTLDTDHIWQTYKFEINKAKPPNLLFIGRLVANKRLELLFEYFKAIKQITPGASLTIIGDGPRSDLVKSAVKNDPDIRWTGAIVDEAAISVEMQRAHVVFVPGWSGLSVVHAFAYGKPYITLAGLLHAPEISYLRNGENGLFLNGSFDENLKKIGTLLSDQEAYEKMCRSAFQTAQELSIDNWCDQMATALTLDNRR